MRRLAFFALVVLLAAATKFYAAGSTEAPANFILHEAPRPLPEIAIVDGDRKTGALADFRGKFVLLNIWATWCVPCRKEMPTLDRLQARLGGSDFQVVTLSIDRGGADAVRKFYANVGVKNLAININSSAEATFKLGAVGLPTTLLINREGQEIGRLIGGAEWDSPEMVNFLKTTIAKDRRSSSTPTPTPTQEKPI